jgi:hypothetical protein
MNRRTFLLTSLLVMLALAGCASTPGRPFQPEAATPGDKALIYVYRDAGIMGGAVAYTVRINGVDVSKLPAAGYFPYRVAPGEVEVSAQTEAKSSVTIDAKAGQTYYVKGTIGVGFFVGHPHLVIVPPAVGAQEIAACNLVAGAASTPAEGTVAPRGASGPMATAIVAVAIADIVKSPPAAPDVPLTVTDRRARIVMERTTIGHTAMSGVMLRPPEAELVTALMTAKLREAVAVLPAGTSVPPVACEITEFTITTPATILYWDVVADIKLTLRVGDEQQVLTGHGTTRTYVWPSEALLAAATTNALKAIATQSGPALRTLLAAPRAPTPAR